MTDQISTIFRSNKELSSNSEEFYKDYWTESGSVKKETTIKNSSIISKFFPHGLTGNKILEIGVGGEGGALLQLKDNNDVHGLDVSDSAINNCRRFGINVTKANLDNDSIPFQPEYFDVVFAFEVLEHFANPQHAIEEIRRVLKPGGIFISSIPAVFTYHWPRLFYAGLFEKENFQDFLMANEFGVTCFNDWMMHNRYGKYNVSPDISSWSWYWRAEKLREEDAQGYMELGRHFFNKKNEFGMRSRPVEAIDLLRKGLKFNPDDMDMKLLFARALIYRAINGDVGEFLGLINDIMSNLMSSECKNRVENFARLLLIDVESSRMGFQVLEVETFNRMKAELSQVAGTEELLKEIYYEEEITRCLAAMK